MKDLEGQKAIVTGGSRGIGKGIALALAEAGADVAILYRVKTDEANCVIESIRKSGQQGLAIQVDVLDNEKLEDAITQVVKQFGKIDILVNNAGRSPRPVKDGDRELKDWERVLNVNLNRVFYCTNLVLKHMRSAGSGKIINISSANVRALAPTSGPYSASKSGIEAFTKIAAKEEAVSGIRVNAVAPGVIDTDMATMMLDAMGAESGKRFISDNIPMNRMGLPSEIGDAVVFLCSDKARYITGEVLHVTGGLAL